MSDVPFTEKDFISERRVGYDTDLAVILQSPQRDVQGFADLFRSHSPRRIGGLTGTEAGNPIQKLTDECLQLGECCVAPECCGVSVGWDGDDVNAHAWPSHP